MGKASTKELPVKPSELFLHFCLSHIMHAFSRYLKKFFAGTKKKFIMYCCSILANSVKQETFRKTIHCLFVVLLVINKKSIDCLVNHEDLKPITNDMKMVESFERLSEERYYQQSKRSQYYKDYHKVFQLVKEERKSSSIISKKMIYIVRSMVGIYQTTGQGQHHYGPLYTLDVNQKRTAIFEMEQNIWKL